MIYLQKSKKKNKKIVVSFVLIIVFLVIAGLSITKLSTPLGGALRFVGTPIWSMDNFVGEKLRGFTGFFQSKNALLGENNSLRAELDTLREKLVAFDTINAEHTKLLQDFGRTTDIKRILATVLVRPPQSPYDILILDIGSRDNIMFGDVVYSAGGIALGTISEITGRSSKVTLFSRTDVETPAVIERTGLAVTLHGTGGGSFEVQVPQDADIAKSDMVIMPKLETTVIGQVIDIESSVKSAFKRVLIQTPINISYERFVFVEPKN